MKNFDKLFFLQLLLFLTGIFPCETLTAHFVWIANDALTGETRVYFGERPEPDQKMYLKGISGIRTWCETKDHFSLAKFEPREDGELGWLVVNAGRKHSEVLGDVTYGTFSRGKQAMLLHYCAKYGRIRKQQSLSEKPGRLLPLDIHAAVNGAKLNFCVTSKQKPLGGCEVTVMVNGESRDYETNDQGKFSVAACKGRFLVRAKSVDPTPGRHGEEDYAERRTYCTLVLDVLENSLPTGNERQSDTSQQQSELELADIPEGLTSFGGAVANNRIYLYGGHTGTAHNYYESGQNKTLYELDLRKPDRWNRVAQGLGLQGLAMVTCQGKLYRLGGFHAHNREGEKQDLRSVPDFAVFDFDQKKWRALQPMPTGRSSFDAVVVKDTIYVVGGWTMRGQEEATWCKTALKFDLSKDDSRWETIATPPFQRRALSLGFQADRLVAIGGMQSKGGPTRKVAFYEMKKNAWSEGPDLPDEGRMEGFGSSSFNVGGRLITSTYGGNVYRLSKDFSEWESISKLDDGRFFHRLLPLDSKRFVLVGGANMETGKFLEVEVLSR
ncbi:MAG: hypothetical protein VX768_10525 [Planctomycetota bacterium]|nr:hypothetical protein [Planctomycetota bacterium]